MLVVMVILLMSPYLVASSGQAEECDQFTPFSQQHLDCRVDRVFHICQGVKDDRSAYRKCFLEGHEEESSLEMFRAQQILNTIHQVSEENLAKLPSVLLGEWTPVPTRLEPQIEGCGDIRFSFSGDSAQVFVNGSKAVDGKLFFKNSYWLPYNEDLLAPPKPGGYISVNAEVNDHGEVGRRGWSWSGSPVGNAQVFFDEHGIVYYYHIQKLDPISLFHPKTYFGKHYAKGWNTVVKCERAIEKSE